MAKVGVLGARGRMGREVIRTVSEAPDLEVVAEVDQAFCWVLGATPGVAPMDFQRPW